MRAPGTFGSPSPSNSIPTVLSLPALYIQLILDTQLFEFLKLLPEIRRVIVFRDGHVGQLMNKDVHRRVDIVSVQAQVNLLSFVDVRSYRPLVLGPLDHPREDRRSQDPVPCGVSRRPEHIQDLPVLGFDFRQHLGLLVCNDYRHKYHK